jgi:hypothetical protein
MSRSTPRKSRHRRHPSGGGPRIIAASDYESDAAHYMEQRDSLAGPAAPVSRDNNEMNFRVLSRYVPNLRAILSIAANAVIYNFAQGTAGTSEQPAQQWEKSGYEGTMFVCEMESLSVASLDGNQYAVPQYCIFILNRRGPDNFQVNLLRVSECEDMDSLMILGTEEDHTTVGPSGQPQGERKVVGLWIHPDKVNTRETNTSVILALWKQCRDTISQLAIGFGMPQNAGFPAPGSSGQAEPEYVPAEEVAPPTGRRLSITDLFGQKIGNG